MEVVNPSYEILSPKNTAEADNELFMIERVARTCYKSEEKFTGDLENTKKFVKMLRDRGHTAMLEFGNMIVKFICDRGVTHELVRHRLVSYAQESTRFCDYNGKGIQVIEPPGLDESERLVWIQHMDECERGYSFLRGNGITPQIARSVLPTCLKTEIVAKANFTEWRHIFKLRTAKAAHPQMRELMIPLLAEAQELIPVIFDDIEVGE